MFFYCYIKDHVYTSVNMIDIGKGGQREVKDYILDRYACYCIAVSSSAKNALKAKAYFISTTLQVEDIMYNGNNHSRLDKRADFSGYRKRLNRQYAEEGVSSPAQFAYIHDQGNIGFFGGMNTKQIREMCDYPSYKPIEDAMSGDALLFKAVADTGAYYANIKENPETVEEIASIEKSQNSQARDVMKQFTGSYPEDGMPETDTKLVKRGITKNIKDIKKESLSNVLNDRYEIGGVSNTIADWCRFNNISVYYAIDELSKGRTLEDIIASSCKANAINPIYFGL